ncbi:MAG: porphobilinogen synthase [Alphaproteobacteria bacterium]|nr:porphobilinogen synthase [Alphaproteobacteria bacterium]
MTNFPPRNFPRTRLRRPRQAEWSRRLVAETRLTPADLIWPIILREGAGVREPVASLPGVERVSIDLAVEAARAARDLGVPALALFPFTGPEHRSPRGDLALDRGNLMCRAAEAIKAAVPDVGLIADVALDPYTDHGHDGVLVGGEIDNDATVEILVRQAIVQAGAGYDVVAPSDMMDGRVGAIRDGLEAAGYKNTQIVSYAAKYASALYGPYRDAIGASGVLKGDKRTYQMNPANTDEAVHEMALDVAEGADGVMVKPAGFYLDVIRRARVEIGAPTYAFQVSGECAMIEAAGANGWIDRDRAVMESLMAIKRAGADAIISYFAPWAARALG